MFVTRCQTTSKGDKNMTMATKRYIYNQQI